MIQNADTRHKATDETTTTRITKREKQRLEELMPEKSSAERQRLLVNHWEQSKTSTHPAHQDFLELVHRLRAKDRGGQVVLLEAVRDLCEIVDQLPSTERGPFLAPIAQQVEAVAAEADEQLSRLRDAQDADEAEPQVRIRGNPSAQTEADPP